MPPFESPVIVRSNPCPDDVGSADAPEAPRVSPKPYARSRATRPPTANRPASAIPLTETCAASEARRVARLRAASCATPASLPLRARHGLPRALRGRNAPASCPSRRGSGGAGERRGEFFGPDVAGDAPVHLAEPCRGAPEKARSELLPAPQRRIETPVKSGIRVIFATPLALGGRNMIYYALFSRWGSSSVGRASRSQRGGREFESLLLHQIAQNDKTRSRSS